MSLQDRLPPYRSPTQQRESSVEETVCHCIKISSYQKFSNVFK